MREILPLLASLLLLVATLPGCREAAQPEAETGAQKSGEDLDSLRALPYARFAEKASAGEESGVVFHDRERSQPGYNLFTLETLCAARLMDAAGRAVHTWRRTPCDHWGHAELLPDGELLVVGDDRLDEPTGPRGRTKAPFLMRLGRDGTLRWKRALRAHHDVELSPRGQVVALLASVESRPRFDRQAKIRDNQIGIFDPGGELLERVSIFDLLTGSADFTFQPVEAKEREGRDPAIGLLHCNGVEWMRHADLAARDPHDDPSLAGLSLYAPSNVVVTCRHQDLVAVFDLGADADARRLVWAWGPGEVSGPHDATVLPDGRFLLFDNGLARGWSRVVELDPLSREIVWEYRASPPESFFTKTRGSNQRLANGNTLITESEEGRAFEVTPAGEIVWEYLNPHMDEEGKRAILPRMHRFDAEAIEALLGHGPGS